jgi:hypothetical protein
LRGGFFGQKWHENSRFERIVPENFDNSRELRQLMFGFCAGCLAVLNTACSWFFEREVDAGLDEKGVIDYIYYSRGSLNVNKNIPPLGRSASNRILSIKYLIHPLAISTY